MKAGDAIGEWVVVRTLGKGGMGTVFLCHHRDDESNFAALKLFPSWSTDEDGFKRFQRECDVLGRLRHRGIVPLKAGTTSFGRDSGSGVYWLAMEYVDGPSLEARLDHGPLPSGYSADVFHTLSDALEYAHRQGVFHRDIKPANIVLGSDGVRLVDFGIALQEEKARLTAVGTFAGTLAYMAPEVVVDDRTRPDPVLGDIYALGVVMYEAITARRAFATETGLSERERQMRILRMKMSAHVLDPGDDVPPPLRELVRRATAPRPDDRIQAWGEFRTYLEQVPFSHDLPIVVDMTPAATNDEDDLPLGESTGTGYRRRVTRPARGLRLGRRPSYAPPTDPSGVGPLPALGAAPGTPQGRVFTAFEGDVDSGFTELPSRDEVTEATDHTDDPRRAITGPDPRRAPPQEARPAEPRPPERRAEPRPERPTRPAKAAPAVPPPAPAPPRSPPLPPVWKPPAADAAAREPAPQVIRSRMPAPEPRWEDAPTVAGAPMPDRDDVDLTEPPPTRADPPRAEARPEPPRPEPPRPEPPREERRSVPPATSAPKPAISRVESTKPARPEPPRPEPVRPEPARAAPPVVPPPPAEPPRQAKAPPVPAPPVSTPAPPLPVSVAPPVSPPPAPPVQAPPARPQPPPQPPPLRPAARAEPARPEPVRPVVQARPPAPEKEESSSSRKVLLLLLLLMFAIGGVVTVGGAVWFFTRGPGAAVPPPPTEAVVQAPTPTPKATAPTPVEDAVASWSDTGLNQAPMLWPVKGDPGAAAVPGSGGGSGGQRVQGRNDAQGTGGTQVGESTKKKIYFTVSGEAKADVYIDGQRRGTAPLTLYLEPGEYGVEFRGSDGKVARDVEVSTYGANEFRFEPGKRKVTSVHR